MHRPSVVVRALSQGWQVDGGVCEQWVLVVGWLQVALPHRLQQLLLADPAIPIDVDQVEQATQRRQATHHPEQRENRRELAEVDRPVSVVVDRRERGAHATHQRIKTHAPWRQEPSDLPERGRGLTATPDRDEHLLEVDAAVLVGIELREERVAGGGIDRPLEDQGQRLVKLVARQVAIAVGVEQPAQRRQVRRRQGEMVCQLRDRAFEIGRHEVVRGAQEAGEDLAAARHEPSQIRAAIVGEPREHPRKQVEPVADRRDGVREDHRILEGRAHSLAGEGQQRMCGVTDDHCVVPTQPPAISASAGRHRCALA